MSAVPKGQLNTPCLLCLCLQVLPHVLIVWRPDLHSYTAHITHKVNGSAPVTAKINNVDLPNFVAQGLGKAIQLWQEDVHVSAELAGADTMQCFPMAGSLSAERKDCGSSSGSNGTKYGL
jgi:hypothetical protein